MVHEVRRLLAQPPASFDVTLTSPVVRVQARFGKTWGAPGSGFLIQDWPRSVITARHVVALASGAAPDAVVVRGLSGGRWRVLPAVVVAFPQGGVSADDVAIVRLAGDVRSPLRMASLDGPADSVVWGYPMGNEAPRPPYPQNAGVRLDSTELALDSAARVGMSGGPVVVATAEGAQVAVVGIYLGPATNGSGGRAYVFDSDVVRACKDAAKDRP